MHFVDRSRVPKPKFRVRQAFAELRRSLAEIHDAAGGGKRTV
jgi:hypothetical protein